MSFWKLKSNKDLPVDTVLKTTLKSLFCNDQIVFVDCNQIQEVGHNSFNALNEDPYIILQLASPSDVISIQMDIQTDIRGTSVAIYFSYGTECSFSESNKITIDSKVNLSEQIYLSFPKKVNWLRIDPTDKSGNFQIISAQIKAENTLVDNANTIYIESLQVEDEIEILENKIHQQQWDLDRIVVVVSHEISETGAPLLCRKISMAARKMGFEVILVSLRSFPKLHKMFKESCSHFFVCHNEFDFTSLICSLSKMGVYQVVLNTVVTGQYTKLLHDNQFKIVSLIHEMKCSCKILKAQEAMKEIALFADAIVFPSHQVKDDFLSVEKEVKGTCLVRPQGYYKEIHTLKKSMEWKNKLICLLGLPSNAKIIIGAGSINFGKGVDLLPLIAKQLSKAKTVRKNVHFVWLGSSNDFIYEIHLKSQIEKMELQDRFHFLGFIHDEQKYMQYLCGGDVFALVSREDSMPSTVIEAMACGMPVVAFQKSGGAKDMLSDNRGIIVDYLDINAFADAILKLLESESVDTDQMVNSAKQYVKEVLSFDEYVGFLLQIFKNFR